MRFRRMLAVFAAAASLGVGLMYAEPASAAAIAQTAQTQVQSPRHPDAIVAEINVDVPVRCGAFKGTLIYVSAPAGRSLLLYYRVTGTLRNTCRDGTAHLRAYYTPNGLREQSKLIGNTKGTEEINWESPGFFAGIRNMFVELCTFDSPLGGGCSHSRSLY